LIKRVVTATWRCS